MCLCRTLSIALLYPDLLFWVVLTLSLSGVFQCNVFASLQGLDFRFKASRDLVKPLSGDRVPVIGFDLCQGDRNKRPLQDFRTGDRSVSERERLLVKQHDVNIDRPGAEFVASPHPAQRGFNLRDGGLLKRHCRDLGAQEHGCVQEIRLVFQTNGRRFLD